MKTYLEAVLLWKMSGTKSDALKVCCDDLFLGFCLVFVLMFFCFSVWGSFPCYLLYFGAKSVICMFCVTFWSQKSLICMLFATFWR